MHWKKILSPKMFSFIKKQKLGWKKKLFRRPDKSQRPNRLIDRTEKINAPLKIWQDRFWIFLNSTTWTHWTSNGRGRESWDRDPDTWRSHAVRWSCFNWGQLGPLMRSHATRFLNRTEKMTTDQKFINHSDETSSMKMELLRKFYI